jgi:translation initiation factor 2B subunit (eIF-2B alpha/beta/delta family)
VSPSSKSGWRARIRETARDRERGAAAITLGAARAFAEGSSGGAAVRSLRSALVELAKGHRTMASVLRLVSELHDALQAGGVEELSLLARQWVRDLEEADALFRDHILASPPATDEAWGLFSNSSTVLAGIRALAEKGVTGQVVMAESRPGGEGVEAARRIGELGWQVSLVPDTRFYDMVKERAVDRLVLGCDAADDQVFVNKVGSGALTVLANERMIPVEVWTTTNKLLARSTLEQLFVLGPQADELRSPGARVNVSQPIFGIGNVAYVSLFRTERGVWGHDHLERYIADLPPLDTSLLEEKRKRKKAAKAKPGS